MNPGKDMNAPPFSLTAILSALAVTARAKLAHAMPWWLCPHIIFDFDFLEVDPDLIVLELQFKRPRPSQDQTRRHKAYQRNETSQ